MIDSLSTIIISSAVTGLISATCTVIALRVHVLYLREIVGRHEKMIETAFNKIGEIEKRVFN